MPGQDDADILYGDFSRDGNHDPIDQPRRQFVSDNIEAVTYCTARLNQIFKQLDYYADLEHPRWGGFSGSEGWAVQSSWLPEQWTKDCRHNSDKETGPGSEIEQLFDYLSNWDLTTGMNTQLCELDRTSQKDHYIWIWNGREIDKSLIDSIELFHPGHRWFSMGGIRDRQLYYLDKEFNLLGYVDTARR